MKYFVIFMSLTSRKEKLPNLPGLANLVLRFNMNLCVLNMLQVFAKGLWFLSFYIAIITMSASKGKAFDKAMKLLMVGDSGVGKSCLLLRFVDDKFNPSFITTIGIDFKIKTIELNGAKIKLQIWDTAGQERFRTITTAYYRGAMGIIIVYDVCDQNSFDRVETWYKTVQQHAKDDAQVIIVGNKCDEEEGRVISTQQGEQLAESLGVPFIEASAKTGVNVSDVFYKLSELILEKSGDEFNNQGNNEDNVDVKQGGNVSQSNSNCC